LQRIWLIGGLLYSLCSCLFANGPNFQILGGKGWGNLHHQNSVYLNSFVQNTYRISDDPNTSFFGAGVGYQWLWTTFPNFDVALGLSAYHNRVNLSGINYPFVNAGQFDTLNFYARNKAYSLVVEPKLIYSPYRLQPYVFFGLGLGWNKTYQYSESPTNPALSAVPMLIPFGDKSQKGFAYEFGLGLRTKICSYHHKNLNLILEYRYFNWGDMALAVSPLQSTSIGPNLGALVTNQFSIGLNYQFG
jgi:opacity protein-like surface antigen